MFERLLELEKKFEQINNDLMDPEIISDNKQYAALMKEYKNLTPIIEKFREYKKAKDSLDEANELLDAGRLEKDFKEMVQTQLEESKEQTAKCEEELKIMLLPKDPNDDKNVIIEIRGGAGGEEASLFANSLYRMYTMYADSKGWKHEVMNLKPNRRDEYTHLPLR